MLRGGQEVKSGYNMASNLPRGLRDKLSEYSNVAGVAFGPGGRWALWTQGGAWWASGGVSSDLTDDIRSSSSKPSVSVRQFVISLKIDANYP